MNLPQVAGDNHNAILEFFKKFAEFRGRPFYVSGESYAGIYIPTLMVRLKKDPRINLQVRLLRSTRLNLKVRLLRPTRLNLKVRLLRSTRLNLKVRLLRPARLNLKVR